MAMRDALGNKLLDPVTEIGITGGVTEERTISDDLERCLKSPIPIVLNLSMLGAVLIVLGMMVFQPGASD